MGLLRKRNLLGFLERIDDALPRQITVIAVGGTALTLLGVKESTADVDFDLSSDDIAVFREALGSIPHGFKLDVFTDGLIFSQQLPCDYRSIAIRIKTSLKNIRLLALNPIDIVASKIGRLNDRDVQDIEACINKFGLGHGEIRTRAENTEYVGHDEVYSSNMKYVLQKFFRHYIKGHK